MTKLYLILSEAFARMLFSKYTKPICLFLMRIGLVDLVLHLFNLWLHKHPTQKIRNEKAFFQKHAEELKEVYDSLEDDKSKVVFENILKYRATSDWACLKRSVSKDDQKNQYFVPELSFSDHEVIVDCGAYTGDVVKCFYKRIPGCKVVALEPEKNNFELLQKLKLQDLQCIQVGAWSEDTVLSFSDSGGGSPNGAISEQGSAKIEVKALDHLKECQSATYIKMDIEGAELEALKGAKNIIMERKPKLAICIYHKPQDFFEIPIYIKKLNPNYKLFIHQHHASYPNETVLYAI